MIDPPDMVSPTNITADRPNRTLVVEWSDGRTDRIPFRAMRRDCPCAACISELTGERLLDPESVPETIEPVAVELSGNYALKVRWSDRHDTGLFTWDHLRRLGEQTA